MTLSFGKVLLHDYPASLAWMFISFFWLLGVLLPGGRSLLAHEPGFIAFGIICTVLFSAVLVWRLYRASLLFRSGRIAAAHITSVWVSFRGPITFDFTFEHEGQRIRARMHVVGWKRVPAFKRGQVVEALYDPTHPSRAIIPQLFQA